MGVNPHTYRPDNLDHVMLDYRYVVRAAARELNLSSYVPFKDWLDYPIMAALSCRGCTQSCVICGGSGTAFKQMHGRDKPAYRDPETLAKDVRRISAMSRGPVFILGDLRQAGRDYARAFLRGHPRLRRPGDHRALLAGLPRVPAGRWRPRCPTSRWRSRWRATTRRCAMRSASTTATSRSSAPWPTRWTWAPSGWTSSSCPACRSRRRSRCWAPSTTARICCSRFGKDGRLAPFISPLAPFLDPGSRGFENPEEHGYHLFARTLEEHRRLLVAPSWKYVLNYETRWMSRHQLVDVTYAAGKRLNRIKAEYGLVPAQQAAATERRIDWATADPAEIDRVGGIRHAG